MAREKAARRSCHSERAKDVHQDTRIVPHDDWERANRLLPLVFGACFALMCIWEVVTSWM